MDAIRLLVVDDHALFRRGLVGLLTAEPQFEVVGQAASGEAALRLAQELQFDVVLMDVKMPGEDGTKITRELLAAKPTARVIILTVSEEDQDVFGAIEAGARGYILKNADVNDLIQTICRVHAGEAVLSPTVTLRVLEAARSEASHSTWDSALTAREREVLKLLAQGADNRAISAALSVSMNTVKTHVAHVLRKLQLQSRTQVAEYVRRHATHQRDPHKA